MIQSIITKAKKILKKRQDNEIVELIKSFNLSQIQQKQVNPYLNKLKLNSFGSDEIKNLFFILMSFEHAEEAQKLLYIYLNENNNDQSVVTLLNNFFRLEHEKRTLKKWNELNRPIPVPHIVKQNLIKKNAKKFNYKVLVETGTLYGDMIEATKDYFQQIYSIELSKDLYLKACERFKDDKNVLLLNGDSGKVFESLIPEIYEPAIFFLDGHYSGSFTAKGENDTPILEELKHVLSSNLNHIIIIDDARLFGTDHAYPSIPELIAFISIKKKNLNIEIESDSIIITPKVSVS